MKLLARAILILVAMSASAHAGGFDDFNQGIAAHNHGDSEAAIFAFSRALAAGDLVPSLQSTALFDRGMAYYHLKKYQLAIGDFSAVGWKAHPGRA